MMHELVQEVGQYGLPAVAAAMVLVMFWRSQARLEQRADRLEERLLEGDEIGGASLKQVLAEVRELREALSTLPCRQPEACSAGGTLAAG